MNDQEREDQLLSLISLVQTYLNAQERLSHSLTKVYNIVILRLCY